MKRVVILIDGTWDDMNANTNVAKLKAVLKDDANGTAQNILRSRRRNRRLLAQAPLSIVGWFRIKKPCARLL
jgi:hypothetical protein